MKTIQLTQGKVALVDDADYKWLTQWKWHLCKSKLRNTYYAGRHLTIKKNKQCTVLMHRELLGLKKGDGKLVDHKDHNGLNNQRYNIQEATRTQNVCNKTSSKTSTFKYLGVCYINRKRKGEYCTQIIVQIGVKNKRILIGQFKTEIEAVKAYDKAAVFYHGEFANLNFKQ